jgi:hypothetical protein
VQEAKTTWAVVVGIDEYDDKSIRRLEGAAADAVAAVKWLRAIGVPDGQILLHATACEKTRPEIGALAVPHPELDLTGVPCKPARLSEVWDSFLLLEQKSGARLFVFFSGHGLYDPETERLFLLQDAKPGAWQALGMNLLVKYLLSLSFPRVFLFLDGCQNYPGAQDKRSPVRAKIPGGEERTAVPGHTLAACYAADKSELAREKDGRGVFLRHLLEGLDPQQPNGESVAFDFSTGGRSLDLIALMEQVVQKVQAEVRQTPQLEQQGWPAKQPISLFQLPKVETAVVSLQVEPAHAAADVEQVALSSVDLPTSWKVTKPQKFPLATHLPVTARASAVCYLRRNAPWSPSSDPKAFDVAADQPPVRFRFEPVQAAPAEPREPVKPPGTLGIPPDAPCRGGGRAEDDALVELTTLDAAGNTRSHQFSYKQVAGSLGVDTPDEGIWKSLGGGLRILRREIGPQFKIPTDLLRTTGGLVVGDWIRTIERYTPRDISVSVTAPDGLRPSLRLIFPAQGAESLAGALAGEDLLWIGPPGDAPLAPLWLEPAPEARSLRALAREPIVPVDPGPVKVRLDLPWGSWSTLVHAPLFGEIVVELPEKVGLPPLRVVLRREIRWVTERREVRRLPVPDPAVAAVVGVGPAPAGRLRGGLYATGTVPLQDTAPSRRSGLDGNPWMGIDDGTAPLPTPGAASWELQPRRLPRGMFLWLGNELAELSLVTGQVALFPLLRDRPIGADLSRDDPQVEPLSAVGLPAWDLMMTAGRLDSIGHREVDLLLDLDREEPLAVALAGYAVYANPLAFDVTLLNRVKKDLADATVRGEDGLSLLDFHLLDLALALRKHNLKSPRLQVKNPKDWFRRHAAESLRPWAEAGAVPALRWGVRLLLQLLDWAGKDEGFERWREALTAIEPRLSPLSAWTAWTEEKERRR